MTLYSFHYYSDLQRDFKSQWPFPLSSVQQLYTSSQSNELSLASKQAATRNCVDLSSAVTFLMLHSVTVL